MKEKTIRTIRISMSAIAAFLALTAMVHVYVFLFDYPVKQERVSLAIPKSVILAIASIGWVIAMRRGGRSRKAQ